MVLNKCDVKYKIFTRGFQDIEFTESSEDSLIWPEAVEFAADKKTVLQSVREAVAFRIEAKDEDDANRHQATRTGAVYFRDGNKFYVAFDDTPDAKKNIVLARAVEGYKANKEGCELRIPKEDYHVAQILKRAEKSDRIVEVTESPLELATKANARVSEFGSNKIVQALFGDIAEAYAEMLHDKGYGDHTGFVYVLTPESLYREDELHKTAIVRPVGLGSDGYFNRVNLVNANYQFFNYGRARGVRGAREFSACQKPPV